MRENCSINITLRVKIRTMSCRNLSKEEEINRSTVRKEEREEEERFGEKVDPLVEVRFYSNLNHINHSINTHKHTHSGKLSKKRCSNRGVLGVFRYDEFQRQRSRKSYGCVLFDSLRLFDWYSQCASLQHDGIGFML